MSRFAQGVLFVLAGAVLWGFSGGAAQLLLQAYGASSLFLTAVRMPLAGCLFLVWNLTRSGGRERLGGMLHDRATRRGLAVFGVVGLFLSQVTYLVCIAYTNAGTATVLQQLCPVVVMLWAVARTRKPPRAGEVAALACALAATFLIATGGDPAALSLPAAGLAAGLLSAVTVAFYLIQPQELMQRWGSMPVTGFGMFAGGAAAVVAFAVVRVTAPALGLDAQMAALPQLDAFGWLMLAVFVVLGTFCSYALFLHGVSMVGSMVGGLLACAEPVSASLFSVLWLGTAYTWADWVGLALMLACVAFTTVKPKGDGAASS